MLTDLQKRKLIKLFTMYDATNNGMLNLEDFQKIAQKIVEVRGWKPNSPEANELLHKFSYYWIHLKGESDKNRDYKVSLDEWLNYHKEMLSDPKRYDAEVRILNNLVFDAFDSDGDEKISRKEWIELLTVYNIHQIYAEQIFSQLDRNSNGFLSKEEILQMFYEFYYSDDPAAPGSIMFSPH